MKFLNTKPEWMEESWWRATRTFVQNLVGAVVLALIVVLTTYAQGGTFDWRYLWLQGFIAGIAAGLAKLMNNSKDQSEE